MDEKETMTTSELLAHRAEEDARRWERAAVEMEMQRNLANERRRAAEAETDAMRRQVKEQARSMIDSLDDLARRIAAVFDIHLPQRGCEHDDW